MVDQTTPAGVGGIDASTGAVTGGTCVIRTYSFDGNGNRTSKTAIPSNADGSCQSTASPSGAVTTTWSHDTADRITNAGYVYDNLGRITTIPETDTPIAQAGGTPGNLNLAYFDTDQIQAQTQNGTTITNTLDAAGRPLTQTTGPTGGSATSTITMGYTDSSDSASFETTVSGSTTTSESYLNGPDGLLGATLTSAGAVQVAVSDPRGSADAQITLPTSGDASGLDDWSGSDEYGNPLDPTTTGTTATNPAGDPNGGLGYGWEGAHKRDTDTSGMVQMGARLYNPVTGTFSSVDPQYGGNTTAYAYPQDPVNGSDLAGKCWICDAWHATTHWVSHAASATWKAVKHVAGHIQISAQVCVGVCASLAFQGGHFAVSGGGVGVGLWGGNVSYVSAPMKYQGKNSAVFCGAFGWGGCASVGEGTKHHHHNYWSVGVTFGDGLGLFGGPMFSKELK